MGRTTGTTNWKTSENKALASAVVGASTDAAVGTDQSSSTFWAKVLVLYQQKAPASKRTATALQARWSSPIQKSVNKFIGILSGVMREHHSGWQMQDYISHAKAKHQETNNDKPFMFEGVYHILKRLPKYSIDTSTVDRQVKTALGLDVGADASGAAIVVCAPRPSVGKKKAKKMRFEAECCEKATKAAKIVPGNRTMDASVSLYRISVAAEKKNDIMKESMMMNFFSTFTDGPQKTKFYEMMAAKYMAELESKTSEPESYAPEPESKAPERESKAPERESKTSEPSASIAA